MNFFADENIDREIVNGLRAEGHQVDYVAELEPGAGDETLFQRANQSGAIFLTSDKDFGELVFRRRLVSNGVVLIRMAGLSSSKKSQIVSTGLQQHLSELHQNFTVISPGTVRVRHRRD